MDQDVATQPGATQSDTSDADIVSRLSTLINSPDAPAEPSADAREPEQSDAQAETEPETQAARTVKVKVDGEEREVPLDDVVATYQKESAASKRFEEAAKLRREADEVAQRVNGERQQLSQAVEAFIQRAQMFGPKEPSIELLQADPIKYLEQQAEYAKTQKQLQEAEAARAYLNQQQQAEARQEQMRRLDAEQQNLLKALPHWSDEAKATKEKAMVSKHLQDLGFAPEQIASVSDHRLVLMARESALYRELISKAKDTAKAVQKAPPRVERPGVAGTALDGRTAAMQRLQRSGRVEDAAEVFKSLL